jgi:DNA polymerase-3 subunit epsilon
MPAVAVNGSEWRISTTGSEYLVPGPTFVALDVETANASRGSICSFGLAIFEDGRYVARQNLLTKPPPELDWFDAMNVAIHGIRPQDVLTQPQFTERLDQVVELIADRTVVAHNAAFDTGAIRDGCTAANVAWPELSYVCSMVMARRSLGLVSNRLPIVCESLGIPLVGHHRADEDAEAAGRIVLALASRNGASTLEDLAAFLMVSIGRITPSTWTGIHQLHAPESRHGLDAPRVNPNADPTHPLFGRIVAFTGALTLRRQVAWNVLAKVGGIPGENVTKQTDFLVIGDGFTGNSLTDFHTGKAAKALHLNAQGGHVEVLTGAEFLGMILDEGGSGHRP